MRLNWVVLPVAVAVLALSGCSGDSPAGPSGDLGLAGSQGVVLHGTLLGSSAPSSAGMSSLKDLARSAITVTVQEVPSITTTVDADGRFTLRGLPAGAFTLLFSQDGQVIGSAAFSGVLPNQEITITVDVSGGVVTVLEQRRDGIGHGDIEIEGLVEEIHTLDPAGDSRFLIDGYTVVARPGETAIREGGQGRTVEDVTVGRQAHVRGVWLPVEGSIQPVLAHEIILQGDDDTDSDPAPAAACMIQGAEVGRGLQLEGRVDSGSARHFMLRVNGNRASGPVEIDAGGASFQCSPQSGPNAPTPAECQARVRPGAKVHVSGDLTACAAANALVRAREVKPQSN